MAVPGTYKRYGSAESQYGTIGFPQHEQVAYGLLDRKKMNVDVHPQVADAHKCMRKKFMKVGM